MKLWLILYAGSHVGGTWGPLPYDMDECLVRAKEGNEIIAQAKGKPEIVAKLKLSGVQAPLEDFKFVCSEREDRPKLGDLGDAPLVR